MIDTIIIDYAPSKECKEMCYCMCYKCGKCGRKFDEYGMMIDDGGTTAVGDSAIDYKVEKNLDILIDVANDIIDKLYESSRTAGSPYGSMNTIGLKAQKALQNICETYIEEC